MKAVFALFVLSATAAGAAALAPGGGSPQRAQMNWMLHCQGCHRADATGNEGGTPNMAGDVARFLSVEGGREYLVRVPGIANAGLPNDQLAELLNWTLATFDAEHVPADFVPFSKEEIAAGRTRPYVSEAADVRAALREGFKTN